MIDGSDLIIVDSPDYEMKPEFHIYVRATDEDFKTFDKALIVYVRDLFETGFSMDFSADLLVYPNPANGIIHIQLPEGATHCSIELLDMYGKTVYQEKRHAGEELDIGNFPAAVYYIRIIYNNQLVTTKIIKNQ
jgi:hypothetical protein